MMSPLWHLSSWGCRWSASKLQQQWRSSEDDWWPFIGHKASEVVTPVFVMPWGPHRIVLPMETGNTEPHNIASHCSRLLILWSNLKADDDTLGYRSDQQSSSTSHGGKWMQVMQVCTRRRGTTAGLTDRYASQSSQSKNSIIQLSYDLKQWQEWQRIMTEKTGRCHKEVMKCSLCVQHSPKH